MNAAALVTVHLVVALGMLVVVPLGLGLVDDPPVARVRRPWPVGAVPAALAPLLPRGTGAVALAAPYAVVTLLLAGCAAARLLRTRSLAPREVAVLTALATPSVAASGLLAERAGHPLFGFDLDVLALTVPHFHFAGFAAALVAGLVCDALPGDRWAAGAALTVPAGTLLVLGGYFVGDLAELVGAAVLTAGMWTVGALVWTRVRPGAERHAAAARHRGGRARRDDAARAVVGGGSGVRRAAPVAELDGAHARPGQRPRLRPVLGAGLAPAQRAASAGSGSRSASVHGLTTVTSTASATT